MLELSMTNAPLSLLKPLKPISSHLDKSIQSSAPSANAFMIQNRTASLATVGSNGVPHIATVYCLIEKDLSLFFVTAVESRKYINMCHQPIVAMTFVNEPTMESVQLIGTAERVESLKHEQAILYKLSVLKYTEHNWPSPPIKLYEYGTSQELAIMKVIPTELTYSNFSHGDTKLNIPFFQKII